MKVSTKLALGYGALLCLLFGLVYFHVSTAHANAQAGRQLSRVTSRLFLSATDQRHRIDQMEESASKYWISGDPGYAEKFAEHAEAFQASLDELRSFPLTTGERRELDALAAAWRQVVRDSLRAAPPAAGSDTTMAGAGVPLPRGDGVVGAAAAADFDDLRRLTDALADASREAMQEQVRATRERTRNAEIVAWSGAALALLLSAAVWMLSVRRIRGGLAMLTDGTRRVAQGEFEHRLDPEGEDEFAQLSRDFNAMTERLAEIDELKKRFVSRVSHELKSPLASMREAINLLLDELVGPLTERQRRMLLQSRENGRRLGDRINKLLEVSRLEAGTARMNYQRHDLRARIEAVAERLAPTFATCDRELDLQLPAEPVPATCDGERVEELVENLLENARRFAPEGSAVVVALEAFDGRPEVVPVERWAAVDGASEPGGVVRLSVSDAGPGIPDDEKEWVFTRFFQGNGKGDREGGGVGLGLALCREVTQLHGGTIWVEDAATGGARFTVLLPREPAGAAGAPSPVHA